MKSFFRAYCFQFFLLYPLFVGATSEYKLPDELMYQGKPIDPICLFEIEDTKGRSDLSHCGLNKKQGYHLSGSNKRLLSQGFIGYNYRWRLNHSVDMGGYSYYKAFGKVGRSVIVQTMNKSGGTGSFSSLNLIQREGNLVKISVLDGGDRCNGSLVDARRVGEGAQAQLVYGVRLTAYDFLILANDNPHHVKAYDELSSCAVCCVATAMFQRHIGSDFDQEKLLYVDARDYLKNAGQPSSSPTYQACFDKLLLEFGQKNKGKFDAMQLSLFTHQFNAKCVVGLKQG